eukprot:GFUD01050892.1.p1 GENE.GFUD01050892.1~~GFUD01050892.1.p1  ORF type:complete len:158 (-),score=14.39 GFUD01050892.1:123-596(-)
MKIAFFLVGVFISLSWAGKTAIRADYSAPSGGCVCTGVETFNGQNRPFVVFCNRKNDTPEFRRKRDFYGNPHSCGEYNQNGQQRFYDQLLAQIGHRMCQFYNTNALNRPKEQKKLARWLKQKANGISCNPMDTWTFNTAICGKDVNYQLSSCGPVRN